MFLFLASLNISQKRRKEENETHTGLLCNSNKTHSRRTNRKQNKTKTKKCRENEQRDMTSAEETEKPKNIQHTLSYYHGGGGGFIVKRPWYVFCCRSHRAQQQLREGKGKRKRKVLYGGGWRLMAMAFVTGRKEYGQERVITGHISRAVIGK
jgi:hypothetical protein